MGKAVLTVGQFSVFDGVNYHSYGVTAMDLTKSVAEVDLTDTFSPVDEKEYAVGREEHTGTVTIWKDVTQQDLLTGVEYTEGIMDFEGFIYHGTFYFTEQAPSASIDEGIAQSMTMRFDGTILEAGDNLVVDAGGYGTTVWTDIGTNFTIGAGATLVPIAGNGTTVAEMERTAGTLASIEQNIAIPAVTGFMLMLDIQSSDEALNFEMLGEVTVYPFPIPTRRTLFFIAIPYNVAQTGIKLSMEDAGSVVTNKTVINRINLLQIP